MLQAEHQLMSRSARYTSPSSCRRTKASITAFDRPGSIVKRSRSQSQEAPSTFICSMIRPPFFSFHSHTRFKNSSRPRS